MMFQNHRPEDLAKTFDEDLRKQWPLAQVGFVVTLSGDILSPSPLSRPEAKMFCTDNSRFFANRETVEVYSNLKLDNNLLANSQPQSPAPSESGYSNEKRGLSSFKDKQTRNIQPQQNSGNFQKMAPQEDAQFSKVVASEAEFRQLIGEANVGKLARFVDNKLNVLFWYRAPRDPRLVFGAQLGLARLVEGLQPLINEIEPALRDEVCVALLDDNARPVLLTHPGFRASWKRPFVATEIGETLPHWEVALYLLNPAKLTQSARTLKLTLGLLVGVLVLAIGIGSWLIVIDLNRQLTLARQKTDFVSNVSHELKTPLTSIRMFSELLAEGRVQDAAKRQSYLGIITAETARLTRLINNVLDFARLERGEKKYNFQSCDVVGMAREIAESYRPELEANGFQFTCDLPDSPLMVNGDRDALAQVMVNLLSNAEKYSDGRKEIALRIQSRTDPLPYVEVEVADRGIGVPEGCQEKIFEQFYRAHDSLSSGIQGSGLGLTLARQIARAHGGDVVYENREGGGSRFVLRLPLRPADPA
jgi:signal transduction histidine kinase